jgi:hypothetical protein
MKDDVDAMVLLEKAALMLLSVSRSFLLVGFCFEMNECAHGCERERERERMRIGKRKTGRQIHRKRETSRPRIYADV